MASRGRGPHNVQHFEARADGCTSTLTSVTKDNLFLTFQTLQYMDKFDLIHHEHPTKEQLVEYFSERIQIRKMTENEAARLMGLSDEDIDKINAYPFDSMAERKAFIAQADKRQLNKIKRESISKTAKYKCYGNSIVVDVLYHIFRTLFLDNQPENQKAEIVQLTLFGEG